MKISKRQNVLRHAFELRLHFGKSNNWERLKFIAAQILQSIPIYLPIYLSGFFLNARQVGITAIFFTAVMALSLLAKTPIINSYQSSNSKAYGTFYPLIWANFIYLILFLVSISFRNTVENLFRISFWILIFSIYIYLMEESIRIQLIRYNFINFCMLTDVMKVLFLFSSTLIFLVNHNLTAKTLILSWSASCIFGFTIKLLKFLKLPKIRSSFSNVTIPGLSLFVGFLNIFIVVYSSSIFSNDQLIEIRGEYQKLLLWVLPIGMLLNSISLQIVNGSDLHEKKLLIRSGRRTVQVYSFLLLFISISLDILNLSDFAILKLFIIVITTYFAFENFNSSVNLVIDDFSLGYISARILWAIASLIAWTISANIGDLTILLCSLFLVEVICATFYRILVRVAYSRRIRNA
jgi:hypothetical protein